MTVALPDSGVRRALVTAAAAGIGAMLADFAIRTGYSVTISDRDEHAGQALAERLGCRFVRCDLSCEDEIVALIAATGPVHLLVNNGGISGPTAPVRSLATRDWQHVFDVNLTAQFIACREMVPLMLAAGQGGCIVNLSSVAAQIGYPDRAAYAASKAGVLGFTAALAREVGRDGIRVNAVLPATTRGDRIERVIAAHAQANGIGHDAAEAAYLSRHADGRLVEPEEVAATIMFLASDAGRAITGQFIRVDGGFQ